MPVRLICCTKCGFAMNVEKLCKSRKTLVCTCSTDPLATRREDGGTWRLSTRAKWEESEAKGTRQ